jgi:putative transposase
MWAALKRAGHTDVARCTVERLMKAAGLSGAVRGRKVVTTVQDEDKHVQRAPDRLKRQFVALAPNRVWVADFTYVATWSGTVYTAFVVDTFSRRIVGWSAATNKRTPLILSALEMGLWRRDRAGNPVRARELIHHSDAGSQGGFNWSSQHFDLGGVRRGHGGLEFEDQRCSGGAASAVAR